MNGEDVTTNTSTLREQSSPTKPGLHSHLPPWHQPQPAAAPQLPGQVSTPQSAPVKPSAQLHVPRAGSHLPWPEHAPGHAEAA